MANLVLAFAELLGAAILLDAGIKGASIPDVITGKATMHPLPGSSGSGGGTGTGSSGSSGGSSNLPPGTYTNPVPGATTGRIDQGVDWTLSGQGFLAPGKSQILIADQSNAGWDGGGYVAGKLLDGPLAGAVWYVAEGVAPTVKVGDTVNAGTKVASPVSSPYNAIVGNIEAGWAEASGGTPLAQSIAGYGGDQSSQALEAGYSFNLFARALGAVAGQFQGVGAGLASTIEHDFAGGARPGGVPYG